MSVPFIGQISIFPYRQIPSGWMSCDGRILKISEYANLFSVIGKNFGGGQETFALPNLNGRVPVGVGQGQGLTKRLLGKIGGEYEVALTVEDMPAHNHSLTCSTDEGNLGEGKDNLLGGGSDRKWLFANSDEANLTAMSDQTLAMSRGGLPHENKQPYLCFLFCIAKEGIMPERP